MESQPDRGPASFAKRMVGQPMRIVLSAFRHFFLCGSGIDGCASVFQTEEARSMLAARSKKRNVSMKRLIEIRPAEGGEDSKLFCADLMAAYQRMFDRKF
jgi:hypothetical protein